MNGGKKKIIILVILVVSFVVTSCGTKKRDLVAQNLYDKINVICESKSEDVEEILGIQADYDKLTDQEKNQVTNYIDFLKHVERVIKSEKTTSVEIDGGIYELEIEEADNLIDSEQDVIIICRELKRAMKKPNSFLLNKVWFSPVVNSVDYTDYDKGKVRFFLMDYGSETSDGNMAGDYIWGVLGKDWFAFAAENNTDTIKYEENRDIAFSVMTSKEAIEITSNEYTNIEYVMSEIK